MSKRAEQKALEEYPDDLFVMDFNPHIGPTMGDKNECYRNCYKRGYEQAEKDLALTLEDIESIVKIADSLLTGTAWDVVDWPDEQKYYEEVLKRFKEARRENEYH